MNGLTEDDLKKLAEYDTPTICNALEIVAPERRGYGFTVHPFSCLYPNMQPIVGLARTAKIRASSPRVGDAPSRLPYYEYAASGTLPRIMVIEDCDPLPGVGAFWGEVHTAVHKGLGLLGVLTNGSFRDIEDCADGFQILGGMVNPSHAYAHAFEFGGPVSVHGMAVEHDELIHADRHGAVIIPVETVASLPDAVDLIVRREAEVLSAAREPGFGIDALRDAFAKASDIH